MRILSLGAGVQSTTVFLMDHERLIEPIDHSIFADTQEEPKEVYQHLEWIKNVSAPVSIIHVATAGKLGDHLLAWESPERKGFASIPAFTAPHHASRPQLTGCNGGMVRRQCTKEYKIEVVERTIRQILEVKPRCRVPKKFHPVTQIFGISWDEKGRAERIKKRFADSYWAVPEFPLRFCERHNCGTKPEMTMVKDDGCSETCKMMTRKDGSETRQPI